MRRFMFVPFVFVAALTVAACSTQSTGGSGATGDEAASAPAAAAATPVPPGHAFAQVKMGMTMSDVATAIGEPSDKNRYVSGKAWIPWYFGNDVTREEWHYKGKGTIVFAAGNQFGGGGTEVVQVNYNPEESGYRP